MKFNNYLLTFILVLLSTYVFANQGPNRGRLEIGDKLPDISLPIKNYIGSEIDLPKDTKGKLLILDFWGTGCSGCIAAMPEMEKLQKQFGSRILVISVTKDSQKKIDEIKHRVKIIKELTLPMIVEDTIITKLFPYQTIPQHVWIDSNGIVRQITSGVNTTAVNIAKYLQGDQVKLSEKRDALDFNLDEKIILMEGGGRQLKHLQYFSSLMGYLPGVRGVYSIRRDSLTKKIISITDFNTTKLELIKLAFSNGNDTVFDRDKIVLNVNDKRSFSQSPIEDHDFGLWVQEFGQTYQSLVPASRAEDIFTIMQKDVSSYYNIKATIETRETKCWIIKRIPGSKELPATKFKEDQQPIKMDGILYFQNQTMDIVKHYLTYCRGYQNMDKIIVDETNYKKRFDLSLHFTTDIDIIKKDLKQYGLEIVEELRPIRGLFVDDVNN